MRGSEAVRLRVLVSLLLAIAGVALAAASAEAAEGPSNTSAPAISGTARDGQRLKVLKGVWSGASHISYAYAWSRCDASGAACTSIAAAALRDVQARPRRRRPHAAGDRHREQPRRRNERDHTAERSRCAVRAGQRQTAHDLRDPQGRAAADRRQRHLEGHAAAIVRLPVAGLHQVRGLFEHSRRQHGQLPPHARRRSPRDSVPW